MRRVITILSTALMCTVLVSALAGCASQSPTTTTKSGESSTTAGSGAVGVALGKQIFDTGVGADGQKMLVEASSATQAAMNAGGGGCAACHGSNGKGAKVVTGTGTAIDAPDITYATLTKGGFTDRTIMTAYLWCLDETGQPLDSTMPCWQMTESDAAATLVYLKTLR